MMSYTDSLELEHHGIKGMKWGVRRTPEQLGHKLERYKKKQSKKATSKYKKQVKAAMKKERKGDASASEVAKRIQGLKNQLSEELNTISNLSYNQMKRERRERTRRGTIKTLAGLGAISSGFSGLGVLGSVPIATLFMGPVGGATTALTGAISMAISVPLAITAMPENTTRNGQKWVDEYFKASGINSYSGSSKRGNK